MKSEERKLHGLVLAGGLSRRMGYDKGLIRNYHGIEQRIWAARLLQDVCNGQIFISLNASQLWHPSDTDLRIVRDTHPNTGPMGGILSAMEETPGYNWLVLACDQPFLTAELLSELIDAGRQSPDSHAVVYTTDNERIQPFPGLYKHELAEQFSSAIRSGDYSLTRLLKSGGQTTKIPLETDRLQRIENINDPGQMRKSGYSESEDSSPPSPSPSESDSATS